MSRRIGRILAFQALYSWNVGGVDVDDLLNFSWLERDSSEFQEEDSKDNSEEINFSLLDKQLKQFSALPSEKKDEIFAFAAFLVKGTIENINQIDEIIKRHLSEKWSIDRINKVALSVMRMSIYSLLYQKDIPPSIVIDEAVEIVKDYGEDDAHKFTNAVLDNVSKDIAANA